MRKTSEFPGVKTVEKKGEKPEFSVSIFVFINHFTPVPPGQSSIENDAHGIEKLLLKTQDEQVLS